MTKVDEKWLEFFATLTGTLEITLSEPAKAISEQLLNMVSPPGSTVKDVSLELQVYLDDNEENPFRDLTQAELSQIVLWAPTLKMRGEAHIVVEHAAPNGVSFTVGDLKAAVLETERQTRGKTQWLGPGVDVHHVFFEGISLESDGVWDIGWGS